MKPSGSKKALAETQSAGKGRGRRRRNGHDWREERRGGLDSSELMSAVCKYFCDGHPPSRIAAIMAERHQILDMKREEPYQILSRAATLRRLMFIAPTEFALKEQIRDKCPWLTDLDVVHTSVFTPIADHVAMMLSRMLQKHAIAGKNEVHVGLAGGHAMRKVCRAFANLLRKRPAGLPQRVVFHAMVAGFDIEDPTTAPTTFAAYFADDTEMPIQTKFIGLYAPTLVKVEEVEQMKEHEGIAQSFAMAKELDVILTSASVWSDKHSLLHKYMEAESRASAEALRKKGCVGDMLWRPLSKAGPIETSEEKVRAMTVKDLSEFPEFIKRGKQVLLVLGPCGECSTPKTEVLEAVLTMKPSLITHLVTDSRAAREVLEKI